MHTASLNRVTACADKLRVRARGVTQHADAPPRADLATPHEEGTVVLLSANNDRAVTANACRHSCVGATHLSTYTTTQPQSHFRQTDVGCTDCNDADEPFW